MHLFLRSKLLFPLLFGLFLSFLSCKREKSDLPVSNCKASAADTSFFIQEKVGLFDSIRFFETDTIIASRTLIYFSAKDTTADEYSWSVGSDPRTFTGKQLQLKFDQPYGTLEVKLVQKRTPGNPCFGKLPNEAVYTKKLTIVANADQLPITGDFYGYNLSDPLKKFTVSVLSLKNGVTNIPFPVSQHYSFWNEVLYGSTAFYLAGRGTWDPEYGAFATEGFGYLKENNRVLQIDYSYSKELGSATRINDTFIGVKQ